ncbi:MAG: hypothetical protein NT141_02125 [candidate division WWE3 bacterium]|nr:hypothetical protein [candidate division WWE3 bacterium]
MSFLISLLSTISTPAYAICPVCVVAVGAGIGLSRYLGVDDTITGLWVGALIVSMIVTTLDFLKKRHWVFKGVGIVITLGYYLLVIIPLYLKDIIGHPFNRILGIDKLVFGIIFGTMALIVGPKIHAWLKSRHGDKSYFPFQKVAVPVSLLIILSGIFYIFTKFYGR